MVTIPTYPFLLCAVVGRCFLTFHRDLGYSSHDIISTMFRVTKTIPILSEHSKLEFIKEIGFTHMRILDGVQSLLQLSGCVAKLCRINMKPQLFEPRG